MTKLAGRLSVAVAVAGVALYLVLALGLLSPNEYVPFGTQVYDYYFLSILDGRIDVPARIITHEGHYDPTGRAFVYHGLAPLVLRILAWPFVDLRHAELSWLSVFLFSTLGTLAYHLTFDRLARSALGAEGSGTGDAVWFRVLIAVAVWGATPGIILVANRSFYHEPIAVAYCCVGWFFYGLSGIMTGRRSIGASLVPLSLLAAVTVHARPHVALALYAVMGALVLVHLRDERPARLRTVFGAVLILGTSGTVLLGWNTIRFGHPLTMHGSFHPSELEYGQTYWGLLDREHPYARGYTDHGFFNLGRVPSNAVRYAVDVPASLAPSAPVEALAKRLAWGMDPVPSEGPRIGLVFLWAPWVFLLLSELGARRAARPTVRLAWLPFLVGGLSALFILSFAMMAIRYTADLWPLAAAALMVALPTGRRISGGLREGRYVRTTVFTLLVVFGVGCSAFAAVVAGTLFHSVGPYGVWTESQCREIVEAKGGFDSEAIERICRL